MTPALYFASGESLYLGVFFLLAAIAASPYLTHRWMLLRNVVSWISLTLIVMACPPFHWAADAAMLAAFFCWFLASNIKKPSLMWLRLRLCSATTLLVLLLAFSAREFSHRRMPMISGAMQDHLVVIGDSISSGIDTRSLAWPAFLEQMTGTPVKNLARPGAGLVEGWVMAGGIAAEDHLVLIELGGNDLLSGVPSNEFEHDLELLLSKVTAAGRTVVMFELPLLPNRIAYGRIQRRLASKYGVWLIPKRYFAALLGGENTTLDGLHLSERGARQMASLAVKALSPVLKSDPSRRSFGN